MIDRSLTISAAARVLGRGRRHVERLLETGEFPNAYWDGTYRMIPESDIEAYRARQPKVTQSRGPRSVNREARAKATEILAALR